MYRVYARQVPAREATNNFMETIRNQIPVESRRVRTAIDESKNRFSHEGWRVASQVISTSLNSKVKEPQQLTFFKGAIFCLKCYVQIKK